MDNWRIGAINNGGGIEGVQRNSITLVRGLGAAATAPDSSQQGVPKRGRLIEGS